MLNFFKKRTQAELKKTQPVLPLPGCAYVIGDVHGCFEELQELLLLIEEDAKKFTGTPVHVIFLGDLMDRGPRSKDVIETLMNYKPDYAEPVFLMGNHEEMFLKILAGDSKSLPSWFEFGGRATSRSYGVDNLGAVHTQPESLIHQIQSKVPRSHVEFINTFKDSFLFGHYLCVHAGIRPNVAIEEQKSRDLRWIRKAFLSHKGQHPYIIVHGHSIVEEAVALPNRIAVDTGAYDGGPLTAVRLHEAGPDFIQSQSRSPKT